MSCKTLSQAAIEEGVLHSPPSQNGCFPPPAPSPLHLQCVWFCLPSPSLEQISVNG